MNEAQHVSAVRDAVAAQLTTMPVGPFQDWGHGGYGFEVPVGGELTARVVLDAGYGIIVDGDGDDDPALRGNNTLNDAGEALFETDPVNGVAAALVRDLVELADLVAAGRFDGFGISLR